jgi:hypothetical protein
MGQLNLEKFLLKFVEGVWKKFGVSGVFDQPVESLKFKSKYRIKRNVWKKEVCY